MTIINCTTVLGVILTLLIQVVSKHRLCLLKQIP